ncbi:hypothetical protein BDR07DRAFT_1373437 [Suillus spraguei]|nr:hypothetical protein BDR07DRAFT_1373437 [Suillus spraguei]
MPLPSLTQPQPIASSSSTTFVILPPSLTQPSTKQQRKQDGDEIHDNFLIEEMDNATDLCAWARKEADVKWVEEHCKEMEREEKQCFVLHWFDSDNTAVKMEWVSKCPYYPQWQLADDPELVASLGTDIRKIEVYNECLQCWIPTALSHTISLESGCHVFLRRYDVMQCNDFPELLTASKHISRPHHLWFNMRGERDIVQTKLKAKQEWVPLSDPEAEVEIIKIPTSPICKVKCEWEESHELFSTPVYPRLTVEDFNSCHGASISSIIISLSSSPIHETFSMSISSSSSSHHSTTLVETPAITPIPVPNYNSAKPWQVWPHGMHTIDMVAGFRQMDDKHL